MRTTVEKKKPGVKSSAGAASGLSGMTSLPNSAAMSMMGVRDKGSSPSFESKMSQRFSKPPMRRQAQIPSAEHEADRLSASVKSGSPSSVKAAMGRKMGADFSSVNFHTGAAAAAKADSMGARAFTSGRDIYFGSGGFNPSVAAHELVHTAQQGMVDSGTSVSAAPAGGIQMKPNIFTRMWEATFGKLQRDRHDAVSELYEAIQTGTWDKLTPKQQEEWAQMSEANRRAYNNWKLQDKGSNWQKESERYGKKRMDELTAAKDFVARKQLKVYVNAAKVGLPDEPTGEEQYDSIMENIEHFVETPLDVADNLDLVSADPLMGPLGLFKSTVDTFRSGKELKDAKSLKDGIIAGNKVLRSVSEGVGSIGTILEVFGLDNPVSDIASIIAAVSAGAEHIADAWKSTEQQYELSKIRKEIDDELAKDAEADENMPRPLTREQQEHKDNMELVGNVRRQASRTVAIKQIDAFGSLVSDVISILGAIAGLCNAKGISAGMGILNVGVKYGTKGLTFSAREKAKREVIQEETGLAEEMIHEFMAEYNEKAKQNNTEPIKNFARAKQAILKALGFPTGTREEAYDRFSADRGDKMATLANRTDAAPEVQIAQNIATTMDVKRDETTGMFQGADIAAAIGGGDVNKSGSYHRMINVMADTNAAAALNQAPAPAPSGDKQDKQDKKTKKESRKEKKQKEEKKKIDDSSKQARKKQKEKTSSKKK